MDKHTVDEVHELLQNDPAFLAIPRTARICPEGCCYDVDAYRRGKLGPVPMSADSRWGEIDFSPAGATRYRMISAEWLGPDWEDDLKISNTCSWEEHRYCESDEGFEFIAEEHVAEGAVVRASRVVPIGPWCVYWWRRFVQGYRLELELSDS